MRKSSAFTMMEIMVVLGLIVVILMWVIPKIQEFTVKSQAAQVQFQMTDIQSALQEYYFELGKYPSTREGLDSLVENPKPNDERHKRIAHKWPFLKDGETAITPKSGSEFIYNSPPEKYKDKYKFYELLWFGPSGEEDDRYKIIMGH
ncbi:MAG: type II secretion system protein GspG [Epsilonproteobacteria bacterium]|nr:type II secretion system protein GspG [Campylobacterota bacterium]